MCAIIFGAQIDESMGSPLLGSPDRGGDVAASQLTRNVGTAQFAAPEVLLLPGERDASPLPYSLSADVYSLGVLLWAIGARAMPYPGLRTGAVIRAVKGGLRPPPVGGGCPERWQALVDACVAEAPEARPSADELAAALTSLAGGE